MLIGSLRGRTAASFVLALVAGACSSAPPAVTPAPAPSGPPAPIAWVPFTEGLPPIPPVDAPLAIRIVAPEPGQTKPRRDSTFIYGTVGTGGAALLIDGAQVPVAPNGAFIAYRPVPADGVWRLQAFKDGETAEASYTYRIAPTPVPARADTATEAGRTDSVLAAPRTSTSVSVATTGSVRRGGDTLATGSDAVYARPTPTGVYRWFFPRGARLVVRERLGAQYGVQLGAATGWIDTVNVRLAPDTAIAQGPPTLGARNTFTGGNAPELRVAAGFAPFLVETDSAGVTVTVYAEAAARNELAVSGLDAFVTDAAMQPGDTPGVTRFRLSLGRWLWGYKAFYLADGTLVVRLRRPPAIDAANPLRGIRIVVDPGHPPAGAIGPTGMMEKDANLAIGLRLAERLRAAGADVRMTRTTDVSVDLAARPAMAVAQDADLLISVHNNAFGDEAKPSRDHGTSTYWFHPFSRDLCRTLDTEIAGVTRIPDLGAKFGNLALVRPTWMPSCLTESLFMPIPEQESALRNPDFLDRLAEAHVRGIAAFLRLRAAP